MKIVLNHMYNTFVHSYSESIIGADVVLRAFTGETVQKWEIKYLHNGYYSIKTNIYSPVISIRENAETMTDGI